MTNDYDMAVTAPIWKDTFYTTTAESLSYTITLDGSTIFAGKAYRMPNQTNLYINVNRICQDYLSTELDSVLDGSSSMTNSKAYRTFVLKNASGTTLQTYNFLYDWSYVNWGGANKTMSNPINGHYASGMLKPKTTYASGTVTTYASTGSYPTNVGCVDYAIYYVNRGGGWDAFAVEGNVVVSETFAQGTTTSSYDNTTDDFGFQRYVSEITTSYVMNTGWLTDGQSENLARNLVSSNKVYVHNLKTDTIVPAVITDSSVTYQTYANNGERLSQYKLNIMESQTKTRR